MTTLDELLTALGHPTVHYADQMDHLELTGVTMDSRRVNPGDLYAGVQGAKFHGADYAETAIAAGAQAILTNDVSRVPQSVPVIIVDDVRGALGTASALVYRTTDNPVLYGVTGTNGKTTTSYFVDALLATLGERTGLIGTIEIRAGQKVIPAEFTTPEAPQLHALLADMRHEDVTAVSMEVSSHAISYRRVAGMHFRVAGFTNLTQDHLDLHGSMEEYFNTKAQLFAHCETAVMTLSDAWADQMVRTADEAGANTVTLDLDSTGDPRSSADPKDAESAATWRVTELTTAGMGHTFRLTHRQGHQLELRVGRPGMFNVANAALAALMVLHGRADWRNHLDDVAAALATDPFATAVPGRMEVISERPGAVVDFAHNPDGLAQCLQAVQGAGRTIVVFGATGERDVTKRPMMGQIAAENADVVIITDDDPHAEDPAIIRTEVLIGARETAAREAAGGDRMVEVHESAPRQRAIDLAVSLAEEDDIIVLAGRGHETAQDMAGTLVDLDDRVELRRALSCYGWVTTPVGSPHHGADSDILDET